MVRLNASNAKIAQVDKSLTLTPTLALKNQDQNQLSTSMSTLIQCQLLQLQPAHAVNNLMLQRPNVKAAQQVKEATMVAHAKLFLKHVTTTNKFNLINLNAICAKPVQLDKLLSDLQILVVLHQ